MPAGSGEIPFVIRVQRGLDPDKNGSADHTPSEPAPGRPWPERSQKAPRHGPWATHDSGPRIFRSSRETPAVSIVSRRALPVPCLPASTKKGWICLNEIVPCGPEIPFSAIKILSGQTQNFQPRRQMKPDDHPVWFSLFHFLTRLRFPPSTVNLDRDREPPLPGRYPFGSVLLCMPGVGFCFGRASVVAVPRF